MFNLNVNQTILKSFENFYIVLIHYKDREMPLTVKEKVLAVCQQISFFKSVAKQDIASMISSEMIKKYQRGEMILQDGDDSNDIYYIIKGSVRVTKKIKNEQHSRVLAEIEQGHSFGEIATILGRRRNATVYADMDDTTIMSFQIDFSMLNRSNCPLYAQVFQNLLVELCLKIDNSNNRSIY
jgi:CRP-like cAMP-binding protein